MEDFTKEYLRDAFMDGALDLGRDRKFLEGFVRIFAGELEAIIAIQHASYLDRNEAFRLAEIAKPTRETLAQYQTWTKRVLGEAAQ